MPTFIEALRAEIDALRVEPPSLLDTDGVYGQRELHNLTRYANSELAWVMNRNHLLPAWRITIGN